MAAHLYGSPVRVALAASTIVQKLTYGTLVTEAQLVVGVVPVLIFAIADDMGHLAVLSNVSAGGQLIRVGVNPNFGAPISGITLRLNDVLVLEDFRVSLSAVADGAGALLDVFILST